MWWTALACWQSFRHTALTGAQGDCIEVEEILIERRVNQAGLTPKKRFRDCPGTFFLPGRCRQDGLAPRPMARVITSFMISLVPP